MAEQQPAGQAHDAACRGDPNAAGESPATSLTFAGDRDWSEWLAAHQAEKRGVWLRIRKVGSSLACLDLATAVTEAIRFGWIDGGMRRLDADSFALRFSSRRPDSVWSQTNRKRAESLLAEGRMTPAGMAAVEAARANGQWAAAYSSQTAPVVPDDLLVALRASAQAWATFSSWSNSDKMQAVAWVGLAKRQATRERRIQAVVACAGLGLRASSLSSQLALPQPQR